MQIFALFSLATTAGWYIMAPVTETLLVPRARHVFQIEQADGTSKAWQFVLHAFCHLVAIMLIPTAIGATGSFFMVIDFSLEFRDVAIGLLFIWISQAWVIAYVIFIICIAPNHTHHATNLGTMVTSVFQGFLVPRAGLPVFLKWISYLNPLFWAYAGMIQAMLGNKTLPCKRLSPLSCADKDLNVLITQFGLDVVNPYASLLFVTGSTALLLAASIAVLLPWSKYMKAIRKRVPFLKRKLKSKFASKPNPESEINLVFFYQQLKEPVLDWLVFF